MQEKTISGHLTRSLIQFAVHQGMDIEQLCLKVGLDPIVLTTPDERILSSVHYIAQRREARVSAGVSCWADALKPSKKFRRYAVMGFSISK